MSRKLKIQKLNARVRRLREALEKEGMIDHGYEMFAAGLLERDQLKWLLTQCPLMEIPGLILPHQYSAKLPKMRVYINPKSYRKLSTAPPPIQWVLTDFIPEGGMICSPNTMPGIAPLEEKNL